MSEMWMEYIYIYLATTGVISLFYGFFYNKHKDEARVKLYRFLQFLSLPFLFVIVLIAFFGLLFLTPLVALFILGYRCKKAILGE